MDIIEYTPDAEHDWDEFVECSKNGTIFHLQRFLGYHPKNRFKDNSLIFMGKNIVSVFPAATQIRNDKKILRSHPGSTYGGPVFLPDATLKDVREVIELLLEYAKANAYDSVEMRLTENVFNQMPSDEVEYLLWYNGFKIENMELGGAIQLMFEDNKSLLRHLRIDTARSAEKAKKAGITILESEHWSDFWDILSENLTIRYRVTPTHSKEELISLSKLFPGRIKLFGAYYNNQLVAGTVVFYVNKTACHTFYIAQRYDFQNFRPLNLLFVHLMRDMKQAGFHFLNFGISTEYGGRAMNEGLFRFKEGFGARGTVRKYYRKDISND